jgi:hypothetical protein
LASRLSIEGLGRLGTTVNGIDMIEARCTKPGTANEFNNSRSKYGVEAR